MTSTEIPEIPFYTLAEIGSSDELLENMQTSYLALKAAVATGHKRYAEATLARGNRPPENMDRARDHALWVAIDRLRIAKDELNTIVPALLDAAKAVMFEIDPGMSLRLDPLFRHAHTQRVRSNLILSAALNEEAATLFYIMEDWLLKQPATILAAAQKGMDDLFNAYKWNDNRHYVFAHGNCGEAYRFLNDSDEPPPPPYMTLGEAKAVVDRWGSALAKGPSAYHGVYDIRNGQFVAKTSDQK